MSGAERVEQLASSNATATQRLAGIELGEPGTSTVRVYWVGEPTAELVSLSGELSRSGVRLSIVPAMYPRVDVLAASDELGERNENAQLGISGIAIATDGSGLTVAAPGLPTSANVLTLDSTTALIATAKAIATDRQVGIATREAPQEGTPGGALMSRSNDAAPFG